MTNINIILLASLFVLSQAWGQHHHGDAPATVGLPTTVSHEHPMGAFSCSQMEIWDYAIGMCAPLAMKGMPMTMLMLHYNSFLAQTFEEGARGRDGFTIPNMMMADLGTTLNDSHFVNLDVMATVERWTFPKAGYPELIQIGEENQNHEPYLDAQHPHSSPFMGITLSDTISLESGKDHFKIWFSPLGPSTDGPAAFMHRATGMVNPDAPLGHHIGQDVGHITSTVLGASVRLSGTTVEASTFNGTEPEPTKVDLPLGVLNSFAARLTQEITSHHAIMASAAYVKNPELHDSGVDHVWRYSTSIYSDRQLENDWIIHNTFIYGLINFYDATSALNSFNEEIWLHQGHKNIFSRIEYLQRTSNELQINSTTPNDPNWVTAITLGYTHELARWDGSNVSLGTSITKDFLPANYQNAYSGNPLAAKIFLQVGGMKMWNL